MNIPLEVTQHDHAQRNLLNGAADSPNRDDVSYRNAVLEQDEQPVDDVLDEGLGRQADRDAEEAETGKKRACPDVDLLQQHQGGNEQDDCLEDGLNQGRQGTQLASEFPGFSLRREPRPQDVFRQYVAALDHRQDNGGRHQNHKSARHDLGAEV